LEFEKMKYHLETPVKEEDIRKLNAGDIVFLSGTVITRARAMGLGEGPTSFDVHFEMAARHPASLPVGVVISCWALRHAKATISSNGQVTISKNSQNQGI